MLFPNDELSKSFRIAKRLAITAVAMTPLIPIAAAFRLSTAGIFIGLVAMVFVPIMAIAGYGFCRFARLISLREQENPRAFYPTDWPFPFRMFDAIRQYKSHPLYVAANSAFINIFVVVWCTFLLIWVSLAIVLMALQTEPNVS